MTTKKRGGRDGVNKKARRGKHSRKDLAQEEKKVLWNEEMQPVKRQSKFAPDSHRADNLLLIKRGIGERKRAGS